MKPTFCGNAIHLLERSHIAKWKQVLRSTELVNSFLQIPIVVSNAPYAKLRMSGLKTEFIMNYTLCVEVLMLLSDVMYLQQFIFIQP